MDFGLAEDTIIAFTSDHGEMMGDHHMFRKALPYEGSARVPFIIADAPSAKDSARGAVMDGVVELRDLMPTLLDLAGVDIPDSVDGKSLAPHVRGEKAAGPVRDYLHGEHVYFAQNIHWLTDGKVKYVWGSANGVEQLFDLAADPDECHNLAREEASAPLLALWRGRMVESLDGREEGFVQDGKLVAGRPVVSILAHTRERIAAVL
ncbi:sulfatase-like hydrolase/transferase [Arthrobacter alpinus]|nr:sulfatase-like hydrolase/transferase [Arthrobacter alpinus]